MTEGYYNHNIDPIFEAIRILSSRHYLDDGKTLVSSKLWGKTLFEGKLRSERWWQNRLDKLKEDRSKEPTIELSLGPESELVDFPTPYEVEFDLPNKIDCTSYFSWLERKKSFDKI